MQSSPENTSSICSLCNVRRIQQSRPRCRLYVYRKTRTRLDLLRYCTDRSVCIVRCGLRASFVWLCKSETIEDHLLYHATVVRRCTSKAMSLLAAVLRDFCCGWQHYLKHTADCVPGYTLWTESPVEYNLQSPRFIGFEIHLCYLQPWRGTGHDLQSWGAYTTTRIQLAAAAPYHANIPVRKSIRHKKK